MDKVRQSKLKRAILVRFGGGVAIVLAALYFFARDYWQGWLYCAILFIPMVFVVLYFWKKDPEFLERRMLYREKEQRQFFIITVGAAILVAGITAIYLDRHFGWSDVPVAAVIAADIVTLAGYGLVFLAFRENSYAARIIQVEAGQKLISTGPYAVVRHPMYLGNLLMMLATPVALGTWFPLLVFVFYFPVLALRIAGEEEMLAKQLAGYTEYRQKVRYKMFPGIW